MRTWKNCQLNPRLAVLVHWENFFAPLPASSRNLLVIPGINPRRFLERLEAALPADADFRMPARAPGFPWPLRN